MQPRDFDHTFAAPGSRKFGAAGRYLHVMSAPSGPLFLQFNDSGSELSRVPGEGIFIGEGFKEFTVRSAVAQAIRVMVADEPQVTGGGNVGSGAPPAAVTNQETPSSAIATPAVVNVANAAASTVAASATRLRITVTAPSTNTGSVFLQAVGAGAGRGIELQPGLFVELKTRAAFDVRNDSGAAQDFTTFEET